MSDIEVSLQTTDALLIRDDARLKVIFPKHVIEWKERLLAESALIGRVTNAEEQKLAVSAQAGLRELRSKMEAARKAAKDPVLEFGRAIDGSVKAFVAEPSQEEIRLATIIGNFQELELARVRAAEAAKHLEEERLEKERQEAIAKAQSLEQVDQINETFSRQAAELPPVVHQKAPGQVVVTDWEITVTDVHALYRAHPLCCKVTPLLSEIRILLDNGIKVAGVKAEKVVKSTTRTNAGKTTLVIG